MNKYYICAIPDSNEEFDEIEAMLATLNVKYTKRGVYKKGAGDCFSRVYRIPADEATKLPTENGEPWLPVDEDSGHSLALDKDGKIWRLYLKNEVL